MSRQWRIRETAPGDADYRKQLVDLVSAEEDDVEFVSPNVPAEPSPTDE